MTKSQTSSKKARARTRKARKSSHPRSSKSSLTKTATLLGLLSKPEGASVKTLARAAGWQSHSVRGFLAGQIRKKLGLKLASEKNAEGVRLYRIIQG